MAEQLAAKLNNKLNYQPKEEDDVSLLSPGNENTFKKYEEELEINDFPQQARWKVTSKVLYSFISVFILNPSNTRLQKYFEIILSNRKRWHKYLNIRRLV